jgi:hypothetical protein
MKFKNIGNLINAGQPQKLPKSVQSREAQFFKRHLKRNWHGPYGAERDPDPDANSQSKPADCPLQYR